MWHDPIFAFKTVFLNGLSGGGGGSDDFVNVLIIEARCVGGLKEAICNEGND